MQNSAHELPTYKYTFKLACQQAISELCHEKQPRYPRKM